MPAYDYVCSSGHVTTIYASGWNEAERQKCTACGSNFVGQAPSNVTPFKRFSPEPHYVPFLDKQKDFKGTGKNLYTDDELAQEMKQQHKIPNEPGLDKEADRYAAYKKEDQLKARSKKIESLVTSGQFDNENHVINEGQKIIESKKFG